MSSVLCVHDMRRKLLSECHGHVGLKKSNLLSLEKLAGDLHSEK